MAWPRALSPMPWRRDLTLYINSSGDLVQAWYSISIPQHVHFIFWADDRPSPWDPEFILWWCSSNWMSLLNCSFIPVLLCSAPLWIRTVVFSLLFSGDQRRDPPHFCPYRQPLASEYKALCSVWHVSIYMISNFSAGWAKAASVLTAHTHLATMKRLAKYPHVTLEIYLLFQHLCPHISPSTWFPPLSSFRI